MTELLIEAERHMTVIWAGCMFAGVERPLSIQGSGWGIQVRRSDWRWRCRVAFVWFC